MDPQILSALLQQYWPLFTVLGLWSLIWKGIALWKAAQLEQRNWFIVLLVANTFGILELIYIFFIAKPKEQKIIK